jgi:hypothetical protein
MYLTLSGPSKGHIGLMQALCGHRHLRALRGHGGAHSHFQQRFTLFSVLRGELLGFGQGSPEKVTAGVGLRELQLRAPHWQSLHPGGREQPTTGFNGAEKLFR